VASFAVIENGLIINVIECDNKELAQEVTGKTCIESPKSGAHAYIGGTYSNNKFLPPKPYPSWISDGNSGWKAPVNEPEFDSDNPEYYYWDETQQLWVKIVTEE